MALWIIAIVLVVVFFPILFGTAVTAAIIIVPAVIGLCGLVLVVYCASVAVANPKLGQRVALGIMIFYIFLRLIQKFDLMYRFGWMYMLFDTFYPLLPIISTYAFLLFMLSKNRGVGGNNGVTSIILLLLGLVPLTYGVLYSGKRDAWFDSLPLTIILLLLRILIFFGYVLLLKVPAHSDTSAEEKNAVLLIAGGFLVENVYEILLVLFHLFYRATGVGIPVFLYMTIGYGSLLLMIVGTVLYAKFMLGRAKSKEK